MNRYARIVALIASLLMVVAFTGCRSVSQEPDLQRFEFSSPHMGTLFRIVLYAVDKPTGESAAAAAFRRIAELDDSLSDYKADSELVRLCEQPFGTPVPVSEDLFEVLSRAEKFSKISNGAFDVSIGPFVRLWRFSRKRKVLPGPNEVAMARNAFGYRNVQLDPGHRTVTLLKPNMRLDLGGIAKGFAADKAQAVLKAKGIHAALVAASGDIALSDAPPGEKGWKIAIATIDSKGDHTTGAILLRKCGISTSGDSEQAIEIDGIRYSHIVNPGTGLGLTNRLQVTIIAADACASDALATAVCVLGKRQGLKMIDSLPNTSALILEMEHGKSAATRSRGFHYGEIYGPPK